MSQQQQQPQGSSGFGADDSQMYRVVGIRPDGQRAILGKRLTRDRAESLQKMMANPKAFREVILEGESV